jgi:hypothetical protein
MKQFLLLIIAILSFLFISSLAFAQVPTTYYVYTCVSGYSLETVTSYNISIATTVNSIKCPYGCNDDNSLNYHQGAIPQADLCNQDPFIEAELSIGIFVLYTVGGVIIFGLLRKHGIIRGILFLLMASFILTSWLVIPQQLSLLYTWYWVIPLIYALLAIYSFLS